MEKKELTVLIGGPIQYAIESDGSFNLKLRYLIDTVINKAKALGYNVLSAHIYESFGELDVSGKYSEVCSRDFGWMNQCDVFIAILPLKPNGEIIHSNGTAVELGWASALKKTIIIIRDSAPKYSHLVAGLNAITKVKDLYINSNDFDELLTKSLTELNISKNE